MAHIASDKISHHVNCHDSGKKKRSRLSALCEDIGFT